MLHIHEEAARCLLCNDAPCTKACAKGDPARAIRAIRFNNEKNVWRWLDGCTDADLDRAEQACIHYDRPIRIRELLRSVTPAPSASASPPSLGISFCGIPCENPFFLASSAICTNYDMVSRALEAGWGGVFYKTICMQEIREVSPRFDAVKEADGPTFYGFRNMEQLSELVTFYTTYVKRNVKIPVIPKMTPNITHMSPPAMGAFFAGADAISAINTIKSITMSNDAAVSNKQTISGYSGRAVKPIALRFIYEMTSNAIIKNVQYSGVGGIETWRDALDFIQLGCRNVQVCTAVMQYGYRIIEDLVMGLQTYMQERGVARVEDMVGEELPNFVLPSNLDRDTMVFPKIDRDRCMGCGRCYISCMDGGHQAITFDSDTRKPRIVGTKCVGCHLCRLVCPTGAIGLAKRINKEKKKAE